MQQAFASHAEAPGAVAGGAKPDTTGAGVDAEGGSVNTLIFWYSGALFTTAFTKITGTIPSGVAAAFVTLLLWPIILGCELRKAIDK